MRVLLTGAAGFIGSHVARRLVAYGHTVAAIVRPIGQRNRLAGIEDTITFLEADLSSADLHQIVETTAPEACIHLAWHVDPTRYLTSVPDNLASLASSIRLLAVLDEARVSRIVLGGTCLEAGAGGEAGSDTIYAAAKTALHEIGTRLERAPSACAHIHHVFGPEEKESRMVPSIIRSCLEGRPVSVSTGEQVRDFLHVEDVASALVSVLESDETGQVDICSGEPTRLRQVFEVIGEATGRRDLIEIGGRPKQPNDLAAVVGDPGRLHATGWSPRWTLTAGIADTVAFWRSQVADDVGPHHSTHDALPGSP